MLICKIKRNNLYRYMEYSIHMFSRPISFDLFINKIWCCTSFACIVTPEKEQTTYSQYFKKNRYEDIYI